MTKPAKSCAPSNDSSAWASFRSDQSSLSALWVAKDLRLLHLDSEDWADAGCMHVGHFVGFVMLQLVSKL